MTILYASQVEIENCRNQAVKFADAFQQLVQGTRRPSRMDAAGIAALNTLVSDLNTAVDAVIAAGALPTALRSIAAESRVQDSIFVPGAARTTNVVRWPVTFGSGHSRTFQQMDNGWYANSGTATTDIGNSFQIVGASLEYNGISVPVTWGGVSTRTILSGETEVLSDEIPCTAFGVSQFTQNTTAWYEAEVLVSSVAQLPYCAQKNRSHRAGSQALYLDKAATTITNGTGQVGAFTFTGTAPVEVSGFGYCPFFIGKFLTGDPKVFVAIGDSIMAGFGDVGTPSPVGTGYAQRMAYGDGSNIYAMMNISRSGSSAFVYLTSSGRLAALAKYGNRALDNFGTNDFGTSGTSRTRAQVLGDKNANWTSLRSYGVTYIICTKLLVESSGSWGSEGAQTVNAGWDSGGPVDLFNSVDLPAELAAGRCNALTNMNAVRGTNPFKWKSPGYTTDGTHYTTQGAVDLYPEVRAAADAA